MEGAREQPKVMLRLPEALKAWLKHQAIDNRRTLNSEVLARLEDSRRREEVAQERGGSK